MLMDKYMNLDRIILGVRGWGRWWLVAGGWCVVTKFPVPPDSLDH